MAKQSANAAWAVARDAWSMQSLVRERLMSALVELHGAGLGPDSPERQVPSANSFEEENSIGSTDEDWGNMSSSEDTISLIDELVSRRLSQVNIKEDSHLEKRVHPVSEIKATEKEEPRVSDLVEQELRSNIAELEDALKKEREFKVHAADVVDSLKAALKDSEVNLSREKAERASDFDALLLEKMEKASEITLSDQLKKDIVKLALENARIKEQVRMFSVHITSALFDSHQLHSFCQLECAEASHAGAIYFMTNKNFAGQQQTAKPSKFIWPR